MGCTSSSFSTEGSGYLFVGWAEESHRKSSNSQSEETHDINPERSKHEDQVGGVCLIERDRISPDREHEDQHRDYRVDVKDSGNRAESFEQVVTTKKQIYGEIPQISIETNSPLMSPFVRR